MSYNLPQYLKYYDKDYNLNIYRDNKKYIFDENNVIMLKYEKEGIQYNPCIIAQYAIANFYEFIKTNNFKNKKEFINQIDYLLNNYTIFNEDMIAYPYTFDYEAYNLKANWYSGIAQGQIISALIRAYFLNKDKRIINLIEKIKKFMFFPVESGGIMTYTPENNIWIEEYPNKSKSFVLNGFIFAIIAIYEYSNFTNKDKDLFELLIRSLKNSLEFYDNGKWTFYDRYNLNEASEAYMRIHLEQIKFICSITSDEYFIEKYKKWSKYLNIREQYRSDKINKIKRILENIGDSTLMIFGGGEHTRNLFEFIDFSNKNIVCIIDSNYYDTYFNGISVKNPLYIKKVNPKYILISSFNFQEEIYQDLVTKYCFKGEIIKLYDKMDEKPFYLL